MSGIGKSGGKGGKVGKSLSKSISKSNRAGLVFPVGRIARIIKEAHYADRISVSAPLYLTAVLEYLVAEVIEGAVQVTKEGKKQRISPRHLLMALTGDEELHILTNGVVIPSGGTANTTSYNYTTKKGDDMGEDQRLTSV